ncbi:MAG: hypothetical protein ABR501_05580 [Pyrinomonadaceae bacterium]
MKIPEPMIPPITIIVASNNPTRRAKVLPGALVGADGFSGFTKRRVDSSGITVALLPDWLTQKVL